MYVYQWLKSYPIMKKLCYTAEKLAIAITKGYGTKD